MSLLFMDGFDHYATADILKKWTTMIVATIDSAAGRRSGGSMLITGNTGRYAEKVLPSSVATVIAGTAISFGGVTGTFMSFMDSSIHHVSLSVTSLGAISAYRGDGTALLGTSANSVISLSGFNYVECKVFISDTVGTVDVRVNGISVMALTGQDTRNAGNATVSAVRLRCHNSSGTYYDDFYICNTIGSTNNDFLGDVRVDTLMPNGAGNYTQFTRNTGATNWEAVDEATPNTTDYVDGSTVGDRDSYAMGNLPGLTSQTIYGVQVNAAAQKDDAGTKSMATMVRSGSVNADGASAALGTSQAYVSQIFETDPNAAAAWTESTVNAMEAGVKVTA